VKARFARLPRQPGPVGVNVGKNKDTPNEKAADDYVAAFRTLAPYADYVAINVSSPNTPGLRALQSADSIRLLVAAVAGARDELAKGSRRVPLLVKISPDETDESLDALADAALGAGCDGFIATNTTLDREAVKQHPHAEEQGGLSGEPLRQKANRACARLFARVGSLVPIIGVGGIFTAGDAYERIKAGAWLVQIYTALIYQGPDLPARIARGLRDLLRRDGLTLRQAIGRDAVRTLATPART
jgi:dihydroorotate dehydrogenase